MTCTICHHPANQLWHGQPICGVCRYEQRTVDHRLNIIIEVCVVVCLICIAIIATR